MMPIALVINAGAVAAAAFNLICSGTITHDSINEHGRTEPYSYTYRIDLDKRKWCEAGCGAIHAIAELQPTFIQFEPTEDVNTVTEKRFYSGSIDRETGKQQILMEIGRDADIRIVKWEGQCTRAPFSGFPKFETKF